LIKKNKKKKNIMKDKNVIYEIVIPKYPSKIQLSNKQRTKYYEKNNLKKPIPKKYLNARYEYIKHGVKWFLTDIVTGERVIANPIVAGKPKMWNVNFQAIWAGVIKHQARALVTEKLKEIFSKYIKNIEPIKNYPVKFEIFIFDIDMPVDISNKGVIYTKIIEDLLTKYKVIIDDKAEFINDTGRCKWIKVNSEEDIKMVVRISKSDNEMN
jgi:hypothetical protein